MNSVAKAALCPPDRAVVQANKEADKIAGKPLHRRASASRQALTLFCGLSLALLAACAATSRDNSFAVEKLLVGAGFNYKEAQTPEQLARLEKLPQEKLLRHEINGKPVYIYANAAGCKCLYAGDEAAYRRFRERHREADLNARRHEGLLAPVTASDPAQDWTSYVDDLGSGMLPEGY
jgi:hypothetical protein